MVTYTALHSILCSFNEIVACNNGAGGYTERSVGHSTHLTEPQGIIKK